MKHSRSTIAGAWPFIRQAALILPVLTLFCLLVGIGCSDRGAPVKPEEPPPLDTLVSFQRDIEPILHTSCSGGSCHIPCSARNPRGLCLAEYSTLMNHSDSLVSRGNSQESEIVKRVEFRNATGPGMPNVGPQLPASSILLIRRWIDQGALDN